MNRQNSSLSRRGFASALAAPLFVPASALGRAAGTPPPSDRVTVGIVAAGQRAVFECKQYPWIADAVIVAVNDCQESRRVNAKETLEKAYADKGVPNRGIRMYSDFRELLRQKDIDAVYIVSPDHWHLSMLIPALQAGKHVHQEKPLGVSVHQNLAALYAGRKYKRQVIQYGAELRAFPDAKKAIELVVNGRIGKVQKIYAVAPPSARGGSATPVLPVPAGWDYEAWLGPAPYAPFCADRCTTEEPRGIFNIYDYTLGNINNWGAHPLDQVQRWADAVGRLDPPVLYEGTGKIASGGLYDTAYAWNVRCSWPDGLTLHFMDSETYHKEAPEAPHPPVQWSMTSKVNPTKLPNGAVFVGTEGWVIVNYGKVAAEPASVLDSEIGPNEKRIVSSVLEKVPADLPRGLQQNLTAGHHAAWIRSIRDGAPLVDSIESAFRSDMVSQLAELCIRTGAPVRWDPKRETVVGNEEARKRMERPMRKPWGVSKDRV